MSTQKVQLKSYEPPKWPLPDEPYPLLTPYQHPELLIGRGREIDLLLPLLKASSTLLGVFAPSGAGKSSFLAAGLVPRLRSEGRPVALLRKLDEPDILDSLLRCLIKDPPKISDDETTAFIEMLLAVRETSGQAPVLVLDQFEDLFRRRKTARLKLFKELMTATLHAASKLDGPLCFWIPAYREEFHGDVRLWLGAADGETSVDLSTPEHFRAFPLSPLGTPEPGNEELAASAAAVFLEVIEKPLATSSREEFRFLPGHAERLAKAFGEERARLPEAPLVPELQVVLAYLLEGALTPPAPLSRDGRGGSKNPVPPLPSREEELTRRKFTEIM